MLSEKDIDGGTKLLTLEANRLDALSAKALNLKVLSLINDSQNTLIVDMNVVEFIDSSGLGMLVMMLRKVGDKNKFLICNLQPSVAKAFKLTRFDRVFSIYDSVDEAFASIKN